jgi:hypothetical protein
MDDPRLPYLRIAELLSAGFRDLWVPPRVPAGVPVSMDFRPEPSAVEAVSDTRI